MCRQLCCDTEREITLPNEVCVMKRLGTEGGKGILLVFVFSSAIVHLKFSGHKRVVV